MKSLFNRTTICSIVAVAMTLHISAEPTYWKSAATPPMGWNSYDAWGTSITEDEVLANARFMQERLLAHGWKYIVIDARWYDSVSSYDDRDLTRERFGVKLFADEFGRMAPAPNRFPSAADGKGFKPLADELHAMGLKFGFHMMRGIPRQAVNANTPIEGSHFTAADAGAGIAVGDLQTRDAVGTALGHARRGGSGQRIDSQNDLAYRFEARKRVTHRVTVRIH